MAEGAVSSFEGVGRGGRSQEHRVQQVGHDPLQSLEEGKEDKFSGLFSAIT